MCSFTILSSSLICWIMFYIIDTQVPAQFSHFYHFNIVHSKLEIIILTKELQRFSKEELNSVYNNSKKSIDTVLLHLPPTIPASIAFHSRTKWSKFPWCARYIWFVPWLSGLHQRVSSNNFCVSQKAKNQSRRKHSSLPICSSVPSRCAPQWLLFATTWQNYLICHLVCMPALADWLPPGEPRALSLASGTLC